MVFGLAGPTIMDRRLDQMREPSVIQAHLAGVEATLKPTAADVRHSTKIGHCTLDEAWLWGARPDIVSIGTVAVAESA